MSDEDIDLLNVFDSKYKKISEMCEASPGIVTGANSEFILTKEQVETLECQKVIKSKRSGKQNLLVKSCSG